MIFTKPEYFLFRAAVTGDKPNVSNFTRERYPLLPRFFNRPNPILVSSTPLSSTPATTPRSMTSVTISSFR